MGRWAQLTGLLCCVSAACADNPYVIGYLAGTCADSRALLCSDFESPALEDDWTHTVSVETGSLERSTSLAHRGNAALHAATRGTHSVAVVEARFEPVHDGDVYFRAYLYLPQGVPTHAINLFFLGETAQPDPFTGLDFNLQDNVLELYSPQADPNRQLGTLEVPRARWFCLRTHVRLSALAGTAEVFVDDALALQVTQVDTAPAGGVQLFRAGVDWSSEQAEFFEIYLDDVVLDTQPVTCALE